MVYVVIWFFIQHLLAVDKYVIIINLDTDVQLAFKNTHVLIYVKILTNSCIHTNIIKKGSSRQMWNVSSKTIYCMFQYCIKQQNTTTGLWVFDLTLYWLLLTVSNDYLCLITYPLYSKYSSLKESIKKLTILKGL